jgi:hypothetical protein
VSGGIRPLERNDLAQVAHLYELVARSGSRTAPPGLAPHFADTLFDHPWADPEIPSLVSADEEGRVVGFLASHVRRMKFGDRSIRVGCSGHVVTEPNSRNRAIGLFLMRHYMGGSQDLTFTDTAGDPVRRMWESLGGETSHLNCIGWVRVFRPAAFAADIASRRRAPGRLERATRPLQFALDAAGAGISRVGLQPATPECSTEPLTPQLVAEHLPAVTRQFELRPAYEDQRFVEWLMGQVAAVRTRGRLAARLVRGSDGRVRGWFILYLPPAGTAQVLQVACSERDADDVVDALLHHAFSEGACAVQGRLEGHVKRALSERRCLLHQAGYLALIHAREPDVLHAVQAGQALLTRLEGEWWMGHHLEPFNGEAVAA